MLLVSLITTTVIGLLMAWGLLHAWQSSHRQLFEQLSTVDREVNQEIESRLQRLNQQFRGQSCSQAMIDAMRIAEYQSHYLHEFGFKIDNQLLCSASGGRLTPPRRQLPDDTIDATHSTIGFSQEAVVPLPGNQDITARRLTTGNFQAFLRPITDPSVAISWLSIASYAWDSSRFVFIAGEPGFAPRRAAPAPNASSHFARGYWFTEHCLNDITCAVIRLDLRDYFSRLWEIPLVMLLCLLLIGGLSAALTQQVYRRYNSLNRQVRRGLNHRQVECFYQPIIAMDSGIVSGCEVLCRWRDPRHQLIMPDHFIPEVEANGQTRQLTRIVLENALRDLTRIGLLGQLQVAINAFPDDIACGHVEALIDAHLPTSLHHTITIEITEQQVKDMGNTALGIERLRDKDIKVAIDDFGTGFSNLQHLKELKVDALKIDKSFIWGLEAHMIRGSLVQHIVDIVHALKLNTVAEGVEEPAQFEQLKRLGVTHSQGYLHAKPMPLGEFGDYVRQQRRPGAKHLL